MVAGQVKRAIQWAGLLLIVISVDLSQAQEARIVVHADGPTHPISRYMTGACIEDVNHEVYGGIYSQMIFGESFQEPAKSNDGVSGMWEALHSGPAGGQLELITENAFIGRSSQRLKCAEGDAEIGIANSGLNHWGMHFVAGKPYEGHLWVRSPQPAPLFVSLRSRDGQKVYAQQPLECRQQDWQRIDFALTPDRDDDSGCFVISLNQPGTLDVGYAFLEPGEWGRFKDLPIRRDVAEALVQQGLTVLRYGGSMVNAPEYRWKKTIGPRDRRPPYKGTWYPYSTNGWGIIDFVAFCETAGFLPVPAFNMDESPQDMADFVEYVNGSQETEWGKKRANDGRPEPFHLKQIELGNEEAIDEHYWKRFQAMAQAIWAKDPQIVLVVGDFAYSRPIEDPYNFRGAPRIRSLDAHKKILDFAKEHDREVWFDVHLNTERPRDPAGLGGLPSFIDALGHLSPGAKYKVVVFELNANRHDVARALSNAFAINQLERLGEMVPICCSANCLQCDGQNDNGWNQGLLFLNPSKVWPQPPYFVTQMISKNFLPLMVAADVQAPSATIDVTAKISENRKTLQLDVVNTSRQPMRAHIELAGFAPADPVAQGDELADALDAVNTAHVSDVVRPRHFQLKPTISSGAFDYEFPPNSFTIIRIK